MALVRKNAKNVVATLGESKMRTSFRIHRLLAVHEDLPLGAVRVKGLAVKVLAILSTPQNTPCVNTRQSVATLHTVMERVLSVRFRNQRLISLHVMMERRYVHALVMISMLCWFNFDD